MKLKDAKYFGIKLSPHRIKNDKGQLIVTGCEFARTGKQKYHSSELDVEGDKFIYLDRPVEEVSDPKTVASFEGAPVTLDHPEDDVKVGVNYDQLAKGFATNVKYIADSDTEGHLQADFIFTDADLIKKIENNEINELSAGYNCDVDESDWVQRHIRGNHIAVVAQARAGHQARLLDNAYKSTSKSQKTLKIGDKLVKIVDSYSYELEEEDGSKVRYTDYYTEGRTGKKKFVATLKDAVEGKDYIKTPRGTFNLVNKTEEELRKEGYGYHHSSDDNKYKIFTKNNKAVAIKVKDSNLKDGVLEEFQKEQERNLTKWGKKEADIWRKTDWKARNYEPLLVPSNSFVKDVKVIGKDAVLKNVKFILEISPNSIYEPRYVPEEQYGKYKDYAWTYDGTTKNGYIVLDRADTWESYNTLFDSKKVKDNKLKDDSDEEIYAKRRAIDKAIRDYFKDKPEFEVEGFDNGNDSTEGSIYIVDYYRRRDKNPRKPKRSYSDDFEDYLGDLCNYIDKNNYDNLISIPGVESVDTDICDYDSYEAINIDLLIYCEGVTK